MAAQTKMFSFSSFLMACLFAVSASVQLNDPDWYFWIPLYTSGCIVNLVNGGRPKIRAVAKFGLWLGVFLFIKVVIEDVLQNGSVTGFWSLNMRERVVREKIGSGLIIAAMFLHLNKPLSKGPRNLEAAKLFEYGMLIMVVIAYGLSLVFYLRHHKEMKF